MPKTWVIIALMRLDFLSGQKPCKITGLHPRLCGVRGVGNTLAWALRHQHTAIVSPIFSVPAATDA